MGVILRIELPLPLKELNPNAGKKQNVHKINRITHEAQDMAIAAVLEQAPRRKEPLKHATLTWTFVVPNRHDRDLDNLVAAAKPYQDGLVKAGLIADDNTGVIKTVYTDPPVVYKKGISMTIIEVSDG